MTASGRTSTRSSRTARWTRAPDRTTTPGSRTLSRLLEAAGYELRCDLSPITVIDTHMLDDVERILAMSAEERLIEVRNVSRFESGARRV